MKTRVIVALSAMLAGLGSTQANACTVVPFSRVIEASEVVIEGRYFSDPNDEMSGHVEPYRLERGERRDRYEIRWSKELLEDPIQGQCATQVPSNGRYERFFLSTRDEGTFNMIGRAWARDPDDPEDGED